MVMYSDSKIFTGYKINKRNHILIFRVLLFFDYIFNILPIKALFYVNKLDFPRYYYLIKRLTNNIHKQRCLVCSI